MANIYDIDFNTAVENILPPSKRKPKYLAFFAALIIPLQYLRDLFIGDYLYGASYSYWAPTTAYILEERVIITNNSVLECIEAHTSGATIDLTKWKVVQNFKGGVFERINYNDKKIVFEAVLNKYFDQTAVLGAPIYIDREVVSTPGFWSSSREDKSSGVTNNIDRQVYCVSDDDYYDRPTISFTIYVKLAQFNALGATNTERESAVRAVADIVNSEGFYYAVTTY